MTTLEYLDETTKQVVTFIVEKYLNDITKYKDNHSVHANGMGTVLSEILNVQFQCAILEDGHGFIVRFKQSSSQKLSVKENINRQANNGFIKYSKILQVINFLYRLCEERLILFAEENSQPKYIPQYKEMALEERGTMEFPIVNNTLNQFIRSHYYSHIFPTEILVAFKNKGYKTVEKERAEASECLGNLGIISAIAIAVMSPLLMTHCSNTQIEENQYNKLIEAIECSHKDISSQDFDTISIPNKSIDTSNCYNYTN